MVREDDMALGNGEVIPRAYKIAEDKDLQGQARAALAGTTGPAAATRQ
jgi:hypothetical protein